MKKQTKIYPDSVTGESQATQKGPVWIASEEINSRIEDAGEIRKKIRPKRKIPLPIAASRSEAQSSWTQLQIFLLLLATTVTLIFFRPFSLSALSHSFIRLPAHRENRQLLGSQAPTHQLSGE
jgi:hypothetical protein